MGPVMVMDQNQRRCSRPPRVSVNAADRPSAAVDGVIRWSVVAPEPRPVGRMVRVMSFYLNATTISSPVCKVF